MGEEVVYASGDMMEEYQAQSGDEGESVDLEQEVIANEDYTGEELDDFDVSLLSIFLFFQLS